MEYQLGPAVVGIGNKVVDHERSTHQVEALRSINNALGQVENSGYLNMATGLGKTLIAADLAKQFVDEHPNARVLYLCHQNGILEQAREVFEEAMPEVRSHGNMFGGDLEDHGQFVYATFQTMNSDFEGSPIFEVLDPKEFDLIVVDESHHAPANTYARVVNHFEPQFLLGLTPAPERRDERSLNELFGRELHKVLLEEAIADGSLVMPDYKILTDRVKTLAEIQAETDNLSIKDIENNLFVKKQNEDIAHTISQETAEIENPRMIVFTSSIAEAEEFAGLLPGAQSLHSALSKEKQQERIKAFKQGDVQTIVAVDQLNEGIDVPEANVLVFLRATESKTVFLQQLGRGLRRIPGKESVLVLDFVASWNRLRTVRDLETDIIKAQRTSQAERRNTLLPKVHFEFSEETMQAIAVIKEARHQRVKRQQAVAAKLAMTGSRREKWQSAEDSIKAMLNLDSIPKQRMTAAEHEYYGALIKQDDQTAIADYYMKNLRFLYNLADTYFQKDIPSSFSVEDYFQVASELFIDACKKYHTSEPKLSFREYMSYKVFSGMERELYIGHTIHPSIEMYRDLRPIQKHIFALIDAGMTESDAQAEAAEIYEDTPKYQFLRNLSWPALQDTDQTVLEQLPSDELSVDEQAAKTMAMHALYKWMDNLSYREREILRLRYGLGGEHPRTLDAVGKTFNITREHIRRIENQALKRLQNMATDSGAYGADAVLEGSDPKKELTERQKQGIRHVVEIATPMLEDYLFDPSKPINLADFFSNSDNEESNLSDKVTAKAIRRSFPSLPDAAVHPDTSHFSEAVQAKAQSMVVDLFYRLMGDNVSPQDPLYLRGVETVINYVKKTPNMYHQFIYKGLEPDSNLQKQFHALYRSYLPRKT